ncbi:MAG: PBP1A family penicillin-binding protein [Alphaproteobacteria bacterium]|nr:PBP1A family penicillin-binding protein [Alphaproteobacteria bacterium]NCQ66784.1 PBP1A family penicillin-binding protein [Alphaproteobacteria bacterium]NCT07352.1 PBP1A family penicillin-binding protein [Alphaproteobacteria bacterium]
MVTKNKTPPAKKSIKKKQTKVSTAKASPKKEPLKKRSLKAASSRAASSRALSRRLLKTALMLSVWSVFLGGLAVLWFGYDLPGANKLSDTTRRPSVTFLARDGSRMVTVGDYYAKPVDSTALPKRVVQAFIATEDRRFFDHFGVDLFGIGRAFFRNLKAGRVVQGGSTITQQLAKNFLLTEGLYAYHDRSIRRKVQEVLLSLWLEQKFTKHQIMTIYLNRVYFGSGAFGLSAAAKHYFDKEAFQLTLYESALLAGLLKAPSKYSPLNNPRYAEKRTQQVLTAMLEAGYISDKEREKWKGASMPPLAQQHGNLFARYFVDWVLETVPEMVGSILQDLVITTTLDVELQKKAEKILHDTVQKEGMPLDATQGALISMTPSGSVRAMVGGCCYGKSQFNRAVQAQRQTGSAFKLFVYLAALESGIMPQRRIVDSPVSIGNWKPKNYGWKSRGDVSMADGFAYSVNVVSARLARFVGRGNVAEMASRLGISTPQPDDLTLALGSGEASLLEMTGAYACVAREGYPAKPFGIIEIRTKRGKVLYRSPAQSYERLLSETVSYQMHQMLQGVMTYGTGRKIKLEKGMCAGKSGTSQNYKDAWFIGYNDQLVTGVWIGNDNNRPMKKVTGASLPGKIWYQFMR